MVPIANVSNVCYIGQRDRMRELDIAHANFLIENASSPSCSDWETHYCENGDIIFCDSFQIRSFGKYTTDNYFFSLALLAKEKLKKTKKKTKKREKKT